MHNWARQLVLETRSLLNDHSRSQPVSMAKLRDKDSDQEEGDEEFSEMPPLIDDEPVVESVPFAVNHPHPRPNKPFAADSSIHPFIRNYAFKYKADSASFPIIVNRGQSSSMKFLTLPPDRSTMNSSAIVAINSIEGRNICTGYLLKHAVLKPLVSLAFSHTNVNGILGTGEMFLLSIQQFQFIWNQSFNVNTSTSIAQSFTASDPSPSMQVWPSRLPPLSQSFKLGKLLDVGAGSGNITAHLAPCFQSVTCTEVSWAMCRRLRARGFTTHHTESVGSLPAAEQFDCVLCFNVIDRCDFPVTLIRSLKARLKSSESRLLIATPLPLDPWVEDGRIWRVPTESLTLPSMNGDSCVKRCCLTWEASAVRLSAMFASLGLETRSLSRIPYLSQGNNYMPFFTLDDALFVLAPMKLLDPPS